VGDTASTDASVFREHERLLMVKLLFREYLATLTTGGLTLSYSPSAPSSAGAGGGLLANSPALVELFFFDTPRTRPGCYRTHRQAVLLLPR